MSIKVVKKIGGFALDLGDAARIAAELGAPTFVGASYNTHLPRGGSYTEVQLGSARSAEEYLKKSSGRWEMARPPSGPKEPSAFRSGHRSGHRILVSKLDSFGQSHSTLWEYQPVVQSAPGVAHSAPMVGGPGNGWAWQQQPQVGREREANDENRISAKGLRRGRSQRVHGDRER